jgi:phosphatidylinositol alpha-1,6-mannosyltransferase
VTGSHLLVTNDFPPKIGGIQSYLHELWRRLPPERTTVLTTSYPGAAEWDARQPFRVVRAGVPFLAPIPPVRRQIEALADEIDADIVLLDPAWPLGALGPELSRPYGVILHGAEVTVPARLPVAQLPLRRTMRQASLVIAAGEYPAAQGRFSAGRPIDAVIVPPGVDIERFRPLTPPEWREARRRHGIADATVLILGVSRLVTRKGFDVLIKAAAELHDADASLDFAVLIAGDGRDRPRLEKLIAATGAPVRLLGRVADDELPALYGAADVFTMLCRDRWGGLEQEGFGIVFLEAAAAGVPSIAGASGGSAEAVTHGQTGFVLDDPTSVPDLREVLERLVRQPELCRRMGTAARQRVEREFAYDILAGRLGAALGAVTVARTKSASVTADPPAVPALRPRVPASTAPVSPGSSIAGAAPGNGARRGASGPAEPAVDPATRPARGTAPGARVSAAGGTPPARPRSGRIDLRTGLSEPVGDLRDVVGAPDEQPVDVGDVLFDWGPELTSRPAQGRWTNRMGRRGRGHRDRVGDEHDGAGRPPHAAP